VGGGSGGRGGGGSGGSGGMSERVIEQVGGARAEPIGSD
jgi:hypothetical protein